MKHPCAAALGSLVGVLLLAAACSREIHEYVPRADAGASSGDAGEADGGGSSTGDAAPTAEGLVWLDPPAPSAMSRTKARSYCDALEHDGKDDWRLPTIDELRALLAGCPATEHNGECTLTDEGGRASPPPYTSCEGCAAGEGPGPSGCYWEGRTGSCGTYWSSTNLSDATSEGHALDFETASIDTSGYSAPREFFVRCVRGALPE